MNCGGVKRTMLTCVSLLIGNLVFAQNVVNEPCEIHKQIWVTLLDSDKSDTLFIKIRTHFQIPPYNDIYINTVSCRSDSSETSFSSRRLRHLGLFVKDKDRMDIQYHGQIENNYVVFYLEKSLSKYLSLEDTISLNTDYTFEVPKRIYIPINLKDDFLYFHEYSKQKDKCKKVVWKLLISSAHPDFIVYPFYVGFNSNWMFSSILNEDLIHDQLEHKYPIYTYSLEYTISEQRQYILVPTFAYIEKNEYGNLDSYVNINVLPSFEVEYSSTIRRLQMLRRQYQLISEQIDSMHLSKLPEIFVKKDEMPIRTVRVASNDFIERLEELYSDNEAIWSISNQELRIALRLGEKQKVEIVKNLVYKHDSFITFEKNPFKGEFRTDKIPIPDIIINSIFTVQIKLPEYMRISKLLSPLQSQLSENSGASIVGNNLYLSFGLIEDLPSEYRFSFEHKDSAYFEVMRLINILLFSFLILSIFISILDSRVLDFFMKKRRRFISIIIVLINIFILAKLPLEIFYDGLVYVWVLHLVIGILSFEIFFRYIFVQNE